MVSRIRSPVFEIPGHPAGRCRPGEVSNYLEMWRFGIFVFGLARSLLGLPKAE